MQQKIYDMITRLVRIPSVSSDTEQLHRIIDEVASIFQDIPGVHMKKYEFGGKPSFIVQNFVGDAADIVLAGHLDVVPAQDPSLFEPVEKDGKLWGRGCGDMKDGCALIILLMEELLRAGWNEKKISCRFTTDEETGGADGVGALVAAGKTAKVAIIPDAGDYTYVTYASKGIITLHIDVAGKAAHSSRPWKGDNALEKAYALYTYIKGSLEHQDVLYGTDDHRSTSVQLTKCQGGIASNVLPEHTNMIINIRHTEEYTAEDILDLIEKACTAHDAEIVDKEVGPIMHTDPDAPVLQYFRQVVENVTGRLPDLDKEHGTTDGRYFPPETTVLLYQPTDNNIHTAQEYSVIEQREHVYEIFKEFVMTSDL